jgi:magnesium-transporting ATPase (P-type)
MRVSSVAASVLTSDFRHVFHLPGDKEETAINIGVSCRLLHDKMKVVLLNAVSIEDFTHQLAMARAELRNHGMWDPDRVNPYLGVVIQGHSLAHILDTESPSHAPSTQATGLRRVAKALTSCMRALRK